MISISKCRKLIGDKAEKMTNKEVEEVRDQFYKLADLAFDSWLENKKQENDNLTRVQP